MELWVTVAPSNSQKWTLSDRCLFWHECPHFPWRGARGGWRFPWRGARGVERVPPWRSRYYYPTAALNCYLSGVTELSVCIECSFNSIKRTLWCDDVIITLFLSMVNNDNFFCVITNNIWGLNMVKKCCFAKQAIGQISEELWRFCWFIYSELTSLKNMVLFWFLSEKQAQTASRSCWEC